jgi:hypothetical protein
MKAFIIHIILVFCTLSMQANGVDSFSVSSRLYTINDGLSANFVQDVLQDSSGYIWVATENGLSRFDGFYFVNFTIENTPEFFKDNKVHRLRLFDNTLYIISKSHGILALDLKTYRFEIIAERGSCDIVFRDKSSFAVLFMDGLLISSVNGDTTALQFDAISEVGVLALMHEHLIVLLPKVGILNYNFSSLHLLTQNTEKLPSGYHNKFWEYSPNEFLYKNNLQVWSLDTNLHVEPYYNLPFQFKSVSDFVEVPEKNYGILVKRFNSPYLYKIDDSSSIRPLTNQRNQGVRVLLKVKNQDVFFGASSFGLIKYVISYPGQKTDQTLLPITLSFYEIEMLHSQKRYLAKPDAEILSFESQKENIKLYFTSFDYAQSPSDIAYAFKLNGVDISQGKNPYINIYSLSHGKHELKIISRNKDTNQEEVAVFTIKSILPFTQTKPFWIMLIVLWIVAGSIILFAILKSFKEEFKIKETISMDLHDELGTVLTRSFMKVNLMQDLGNKQFTSIAAEINTSLHLLRTYIAILPLRKIKLSMLVASVKDVLSRFMDTHDMVFSFKFDFTNDMDIHSKCYRDVMFCLNEICPAIPENNALVACEIQLDVIRDFLEFEFVFVQENPCAPCIGKQLLDRLDKRFVLTQRGKVSYLQPKETTEKITLLFNYKT